MFSLLLKELIFYFYLLSLQLGLCTVAPRTSTIVQFIFYFWSFEISVNILRNQGHWWGFISRNFVVWPIFYLMNVFISLKGPPFLFLFTFISTKNFCEKSGIRAKIDPRKLLHAVFFITAEQLHWRQDVADVQSKCRGPWFILTSLNVM